MAAGGDALRETVCRNFRYTHVAIGKRSFVAHLCRFRRGESVSAGPVSNDPGDVGSIILVGEEVVGAVDGDEGLGMSCGVEDDAGVVDRDRGIHWEVDPQQRRPEGSDAFGLRLHFEIAQKLQLDAERSASQIQFSNPVALDGGQVVAKQLHHLMRVRGCADRDYCRRLGYPTRRRQDRRSAQ